MPSVRKLWHTGTVFWGAGNFQLSKNIRFAYAVDFLTGSVITGLPYYGITDQ